MYTDLELTDDDKQHILDQIDWKAIEETQDTDQHDPRPPLVPTVVGVTLDGYKGTATICATDDHGHEESIPCHNAAGEGSDHLATAGGTGNGGGDQRTAGTSSPAGLPEREE